MSRDLNLPPFGALRALDLLESLGTASAVASELGQTQGAISRQIKSLEEYLNVPLVRREKQRLLLTREARVYLEDVRKGMSLIRLATSKLRSDHMGGTLTLAILPAFGMRWLMPKLSEFSARHPDITLNMLTRLRPFDFNDDPIDAALHFGAPDWPNVDALKLMQEYCVPVATPEFIKHNNLTSITALAQAPLMHMETRPTAWSDWFTKQGSQLAKTSGPVFDQFSTMIQAVLHGQGVALLPRYLIEQDLASGKLVQVVQADGRNDKAYFLIWAKDHEISPKLRLFRDWLATRAEDEDALPR